MKRLIAISVCALLGIVGGYFAAPIASWWYITSHEPDLLGAQMLYLVECFAACNSEDQAASERVTKLTGYLSTLQTWKAQNPQSQVLDQEIGLIYIRLSQTEGKLGHDAQAKEYLGHAQTELTALGWKNVSAAHLTALVTQLDSENKQDNQKKQTAASARKP